MGLLHDYIAALFGFDWFDGIRLGGMLVSGWGLHSDWPGRINAANGCYGLSADACALEAQSDLHFRDLVYEGAEYEKSFHCFDWG